MRRVARRVDSRRFRSPTEPYAPPGEALSGRRDYDEVAVAPYPDGSVLDEAVSLFREFGFRQDLGLSVLEDQDFKIAPTMRVLCDLHRRVPAQEQSSADALPARDRGRGLHEGADHARQERCTTRSCGDAPGDVSRRPVKWEEPDPRSRPLRSTPVYPHGGSCREPDRCDPYNVRSSLPSLGRASEASIVSFAEARAEPGGPAPYRSSQPTHGEYDGDRWTAAAPSAPACARQTPNPYSDGYGSCVSSAGQPGVSSRFNMANARPLPPARPAAERVRMENLSTPQVASLKTSLEPVAVSAFLSNFGMAVSAASPRAVPILDLHVQREFDDWARGEPHSAELNAWLAGQLTVCLNRDSPRIKHLLHGVVERRIVGGFALLCAIRRLGETHTVAEGDRALRELSDAKYFCKGWDSDQVHAHADHLSSLVRMLSAGDRNKSFIHERTILDRLPTDEFIQRGAHVLFDEIENASNGGQGVSFSYEEFVNRIAVLLKPRDRGFGSGFAAAPTRSRANIAAIKPVPASAFSASSAPPPRKCLNCGEAGHSYRTCSATCPGCELPFCPGTRGADCVCQNKVPPAASLINADGRPLVRPLIKAINAVRQKRGHAIIDDSAAPTPFRSRNRDRVAHAAVEDGVDSYDDAYIVEMIDTFYEYGGAVDNDCDAGLPHVAMCALAPPPLSAVSWSAYSVCAADAPAADSCDGTDDAAFSAVQPVASSALSTTPHIAATDVLVASIAVVPSPSSIPQFGLDSYGSFERVIIDSGANVSCLSNSLAADALPAGGQGAVVLGIGGVKHPVAPVVLDAPVVSECGRNLSLPLAAYALSGEGRSLLSVSQLRDVHGAIVYYEPAAYVTFPDGLAVQMERSNGLYTMRVYFRVRSPPYSLRDRSEPDDWGRAFRGATMARPCSSLFPPPSVLLAYLASAGLWGLARIGRGFICVFCASSVSLRSSTRIGNSLEIWVGGVFSVPPKLMNIADLHRFIGFADDVRVSRRRDVLGVVVTLDADSMARTSSRSLPHYDSTHLLSLSSTISGV